MDLLMVYVADPWVTHGFIVPHDLPMVRPYISHGFKMLSRGLPIGPMSTYGAVHVSQMSFPISL